MENLIQDKQSALLHVLQHVGLSEIKRDGVTREFYSYSHYQVLLNLLMEKGTPAPLREKFSRLGWANKASGRNHLYEYADVRSAAPVQPGQIISFWDKADKLTNGIALKVNEAGCPTEYVALQDRSYRTFLELAKEEIPLNRVYEIFEPYTEPRKWSEDETAAAFYCEGEKDALRRLIQLQNTDPDTTIKLGGVSYNLGSTDDSDIFRHVALNSPLELKPALFQNKYPQVISVCRFFGEGVVNYKPEDKLRYGTVLFLKNEGIGVVLVNDAAGKPAIMLSYFEGTYQFCQVKTEEIESHWYPSTEPFKFTDTQNAAYTDLNGFIRHLLLWWHTGEFGDKPLLKSERFLHKKYLSAAFIDLLKSGPDKRAEWRDYLAGKGSGLQSNATPIEPGDLLLLASEDGINPGIALHKNNVMYFNYEYTQRLTWTGPPKDLLYVWKPGQ